MQPLPDLFIATCMSELMVAYSLASYTGFDCLLTPATGHWTPLHNIMCHSLCIHTMILVAKSYIYTVVIQLYSQQ